MSQRSTMTMRATVQRDTQAGDNDWGTPDVPLLVVGAEVPCRVWSGKRTDVDDDGKMAVIEDLRGHFPKDADLEEEDRLTIRDRRGRLLFDGPVYVETIAHGTGSGSRASHRKVQLTRHL